MNTKYEYGKGLAYCLGLFLCHAEREPGHRIEEIRQMDVEMWFYAAADHLKEMVIPAIIPEPLRDRLTAFRDICLIWRLPIDATPPTQKDKIWAIAEAKTLLRLIDEHMGIATEEASWS
jgi:hypothetical protein